MHGHFWSNLIDSKYSPWKYGFSAHYLLSHRHAEASLVHWLFLRNLLINSLRICKFGSVRRVTSIWIVEIWTKHAYSKRIDRSYVTYSTVHFITFKRLSLTLSFRPLWHLRTVHSDTLIHPKGPSTFSRMTVYFDPWPSTLAQKTIHYHPGPSTLAQMTVQFVSRPSTFSRPFILRTVHFPPFGPSLRISIRNRISA